MTVRFRMILSQNEVLENNATCKKHLFKAVEHIREDILLYIRSFKWPLMLTRLNIFKAWQQQRSLAPVMNDFLWIWWPMISGDGWGLSFTDICHTVEETPWKIPQTWKLTLPGFEPGPARWEATMLTLNHSGDHYTWENALRYLTLKQTWVESCLLLFIRGGGTNLNKMCLCSILWPPKVKKCKFSATNHMKLINFTNFCYLLHKIILSR